MNPGRTPFPDLRNIPHGEEWDGTERRVRAWECVKERRVCLGQSDEISRGYRQNSAWDNFPTLNTKKGLPRNHRSRVWIPGRSSSEGDVYKDLHLGPVFWKK